MTDLQKCIRLVKQMAFACAEGRSTKALWVEFHRVEKRLTERQVRSLSRYVRLK